MTRCRATLQEYVAKVVTPVLEMQKQNGAVAIKFEAAYLRSLDFGPAEPIAGWSSRFMRTSLKAMFRSHTITPGCRTSFFAISPAKPDAWDCRYTSIPAAAAGPISC